jgi:preprotein translocase subunit YajC
MDMTTVFMLAVLAVLVLFMMRNGRKRKRDAEELQAKVVAGAHVMTNFGVYGDIVSIDEAENKIVLQTSPGNTLTIHRQAVARVVEDDATPAPSAGEAIGADLANLAINPDAESGNLEIDPKFGERKKK